MRFFTATGLINELVEAQDQHALGKRLAHLQKLDLLVLDKVGFVLFMPEGARLLFQVCANRYLKGILLVTTISNCETHVFVAWLSIDMGIHALSALFSRLNSSREIFSTS